MVALPVEKEGVVIGFHMETEKVTDTFSLSAAYGVNNRQSILLRIPFVLSSPAKDELGDISTLLRYTLWRQDRFSGTSRLGLLGGVVLPIAEDSEWATQAGFVFTQFKDRHEIDIDAIYLSGLNDRPDSGRYDISWQYRISPEQRATWGIEGELHSVLEFNGRWVNAVKPQRQITLGLQFVHPKIVIEGGIIRSLKESKDTQTIFGIRFHL